ncbi:MAG: peptide deformylase [Acidobacteria bacterium]|nr:MAG: peptide deformylase [Acidobacteriota bacterium]
MDIRVYGDPVLEKKTESVKTVDDDIRKLVADMYETMKAAPGIGLAAPQVGVSKRLCLVDLSAGSDPDRLLVLVNPEIISEEGYQKAEEGCLSFPGIFGHVERPMRVKVRYTDLDGGTQEVEGDELLARALCHEIDHLEGVVFINRMSPLKRRLVMKAIRKLRREGQWEHRPGEGSEERA